ncbi:hypothetical protein CEXT_728211 [Caerostris extrusa]|uniref:Uncharacterized protein n=1 Tax=Caerostris extrusa TaxID=172846 RepID=A0AAV4P6Q7_CAEEX|nr:hypothetical protein CEXT_728211 [Caerostris extrusa]
MGDAIPGDSGIMYGPGAGGAREATRILNYLKGVCGATTPQKTGYAQDIKHPLGRLYRTQYVYCTTWLENRPWIWTRFMI